MGCGEYFPWNSDEEVVENFLKVSDVSYEQLNEHPEGMWYGERCYDPIPVFIEPTQSKAVNPDLAEEYPLLVATGARILEYTHYQMRQVPAL